MNIVKTIKSSKTRIYQQINLGWPRLGVNQINPIQQYLCIFTMAEMQHVVSLKPIFSYFWSFLQNSLNQRETYTVESFAFIIVGYTLWPSFSSSLVCCLPQPLPKTVHSSNSSSSSFKINLAKVPLLVDDVSTILFRDGVNSQCVCP